MYALSNGRVHGPTSSRPPFRGRHPISDMQTKERGRRWRYHLQQLHRVGQPVLWFGPLLKNPHAVLLVIGLRVLHQSIPVVCAWINPKPNGRDPRRGRPLPDHEEPPRRTSMTRALGAIQVWRAGRGGLVGNVCKMREVSTECGFQGVTTSTYKCRDRLEPAAGLAGYCSTTTTGISPHSRRRRRVWSADSLWEVLEENIYLEIFCFFFLSFILGGVVFLIFTNTWVNLYQCVCLTYTGYDQPRHIRNSHSLTCISLKVHI